MKSLSGNKPHRIPYRGGNLPDSKELLAKLLSNEVIRFGVRLLHNPTAEFPWRLKDVGGLGAMYRTKNEALRSFFFNVGRKFGHYTLRKTDCGAYGSDKHRKVRWQLFDKDNTKVDSWAVRPKREHLAAAIKRARKGDSKPSYTRSEMLGWRTWEWSAKDRCLVSPHTGTLWTEPEHKVDVWSERPEVRGHQGVHACRLPKGDWREARKPHDMPGGPVVGLMERFGKYVLGTEGWRAEWVFIKELMCADEALAQQVRMAYPEIPVCVAKPEHWCRDY